MNSINAALRAELNSSSISSNFHPTANDLNFAEENPKFRVAIKKYEKMINCSLSKRQSIINWFKGRRRVHIERQATWLVGELARGTSYEKIKKNQQWRHNERDN